MSKSIRQLLLLFSFWQVSYGIFTIWQISQYDFYYIISLLFAIKLNISNSIFVIGSNWITKVFKIFFFLLKDEKSLQDFTGEYIINSFFRIFVMELSNTSSYIECYDLSLTFALSWVPTPFAWLPKRK